MELKPVRFAIVGCGLIGGKRAAALPRGSLTAVCDVVPERAAALAAKAGPQCVATTSLPQLLDTNPDAVIVSTLNASLGPVALACLQAGKHVFCEKPLCLNAEELSDIVRVIGNQASLRKPLLMVGFNRRFAPLALRMQSFVRKTQEPLALHYRVNAGFIPPDHWLNDPQQGGGRVVGEVCHFVDFLTFLVGAPPVEVQSEPLMNPGNYSNDNVICSIRFADGSRGTISYLANGDKSYSKERVEVFGGGTVAVLEDFRRLELLSGGKKRSTRERRPQ